MITATGLPAGSDANTAYTTPAGTLTEVRPGSTTSKASTIFPSATPYYRPTSTDSYPCTDPSLRRRPRATAHEIYPVHSSPIQASHSPARHTASIPRWSQGPNFRFHEFTNPLGINTIQDIQLPERFSYTFTPPQHTLKSTASSCSLGQLENEYVQEGWNKDLPLECLHVPQNPRFTERFWHLSKYFFALADCPNDYLNTFFTRDTVPYKIYTKYVTFY